MIQIHIKISGQSLGDVTYPGTVSPIRGKIFNFKPFRGPELKIRIQGVPNANRYWYVGESYTAGQKDTFLSPKQIENWRAILTNTVGPTAMTLPDDEIQFLRDNYQRPLDTAEERQTA